MEDSLWVLLGKKIERKKKKKKNKAHYFLLCPNTEKDLMGHWRDAERLAKKTLPPASRCRALWAESSFQQARGKTLLRKEMQVIAKVCVWGGGQGQVSKAHSPDCLLLFPVPALSSWGHPHTSPQCLPIPHSVPCAPYIVQGNISGTLTCHKLIFTVSFCPPLLAK